MILRDLTPALFHWASKYPIVTVTGPRQSGKTTLCRAVFPDKPYESLEPLDTRTFALEDPRGFLARFPEGAVHGLETADLEVAPDDSSSPDPNISD